MSKESLWASETFSYTDKGMESYVLLWELWRILLPMERSSKELKRAVGYL